MTDTAETAPDLVLDDAIRQLFAAAEGFSREFFTRLAREVYLDSKRRRRLEELLGAWDPIAEAASSVGPEAVVRGYLLFVRGEFEAAADVLQSEKGDPWGAFFGVFFFMTWISSVHLAYHYAVDGLVSLIAVAAIWAVSERIIAAWDALLARHDILRTNTVPAE